MENKMMRFRPRRTLILTTFGCVAMTIIYLWYLPDMSNEPVQPPYNPRRGQIRQNTTTTAPASTKTWVILDEPFVDNQDSCVIYNASMIHPDMYPAAPKPPPYPRVYIYNISDKYNLDIVKCLRKKDPVLRCHTTNECGFGGHLDESSMGETVRDKGLSLHHTWHFSLERIIHEKLKHSPHRVYDPQMADVLYVPYYAGMDCLCHPGDGRPVMENIKQLQKVLQEQQVNVGTNVMTLGKIEREHMTQHCPLLSQPAFQPYLYIGIEQEPNKRYREIKSGPRANLVVAPYPSYGHLNGLNRNPAYINELHHHPRPVLMFMAAAMRRSNHFRAAILDQFPGASQTSNSYEDYIRSMNPGQEIAQIWLKTPECYGKHHRFTMAWMYRSVFCLQPPGDSPTRKSHYDAIVSGCIPVLFREDKHVRYPFEDKLRLSDFTVTLERHTVNSSTPILEQLQLIKSSKIIQLQKNLMKVIRSLQYDFPIIHQGQHKDAIQMILDEIGRQISSNNAKNVKYKKLTDLKI